MIKKLLFLFTLIGFVLAANSQNPAGSQIIAKWKIEDVVRSYTAKNDTVYVVNFWATFCKPCIEEIPDFIRIVEKYKTQKVKLLLVSLDLPAFYPAKVAAFAKKNNYNADIVWLNETNADHFCPAIDEKWSGAIPSTIIVNNKTGYRKFAEDQMSAEDFESSLKEAIGGTAMMKYVAPMNNALITDSESLTNDTKPINFISFKSADSSVYAVMGGKVSVVARMDHIKVLIIENNGLYYTYSNLAATNLKKGDILYKGQLVGYADYDLDGKSRMLQFYVNDPQKSILLTKANFKSRNRETQNDYLYPPKQNEPQ